MIKDLNRSFTTIKGGTYVFSSSVNGVTFSNPSGTVANEGTITTDIVYANETLISTAVITLTITHTDGCPATVKTITKNNPCDLVAAAIQLTVADGKYIFSTSVTGGSGTYSYNWIYPQLNYDEEPGGADNQLVLVPIGNPSPIIVSIIVTDEVIGCKENLTYSYNPAVPEVLDFVINLRCLEDTSLGYKAQYESWNLEGASGKYITNQFAACYGSIPDWSTLQLNTGGSFEFTNNEDSTVTVKCPVTVAADTYTDIATYQVQDSFGNLSKVGKITIVVPDCFNEGNFQLEDKVVRLDPTDAPSDTKVVNMASLITAPGEIDWSTFTITNTPNYGTAVLNVDRELVYTISSVSVGDADPIDYYVSTTNGERSYRGTIVINHTSIAAPTGVADTICVVPGVITAYTNITSNDTGEVDKSSIQFVTVPSSVTVFRNADNNIAFLVSPDQTSNLTVTYKVANYEGMFSSDTDITLQVVNGGQVTDTDITCGSKTFNLIDLFSNVSAGTRVWSETTLATEGSDVDNDNYTTQGGSITGTDGAVDFSSIDPGTYRFNLNLTGTGACTGTDDDKEVIVTFGATPEVAIDGLTDNGDGTCLIEYTLTNVLDLRIICQGSPATYAAPPTITSGTGSGTATAYFTVASEANRFTLYSNTICGTTVTNTDTVVNSNGVVT
jgi:hypothetical protein